MDTVFHYVSFEILEQNHFNHTVNTYIYTQYAYITIYVYMYIYI